MRGLEQIPWLYDGMMILMPRVDHWRRELVAGVTGRVLEVGCGTGLTLRHYSSDIELIGLEPALGSLPRARRRAPGATLVNGAAEGLPFADASFDFVVSSLVFCSVDRPLRGLAEIRRVLKPQGALLMLEHVQARSRAGQWALDTLQPLWTRLAGGCHPNRHTHRLVEQAGFRIDRDSLIACGLFRRFTAYPR